MYFWILFIVCRLLREVDVFRVFLFTVLCSWGLKVHSSSPFPSLFFLISSIFFSLNSFQSPVLSWTFMYFTGISSNHWLEGKDEWGDRESLLDSPIKFCIANPLMLFVSAYVFLGSLSVLFEIKNGLNVHSWNSLFSWPIIVNISLSISNFDKVKV